MIVEDEEFILEGICSMIDWFDLELEIIHRAGDGVEALNCLQKEEVDIILTDISMPDMNGLELIENIRTTNKQVRCIILTGYDEFDYAKRAVPLDVEEYILKPISEEQLEKTLRDTIQKLDNMQLNQKNNYSNYVLLQKFLHTESTAEEMQRNINTIGLKKYKGNAIFALMRVRTKETLAVEMKQIVEYLLRRYKKDEIQVLYVEKDSFLVLCQWKEEGIKTPIGYFERMQNDIEGNLNLSLFVTVGPILHDLMMLPKAFQAVEGLKKYVMIEGYGSCIDLSYVEGRTCSDVNVNEEQVRKLVLERDKEGLIRYLEDLFLNNSKNNDITINAIYQISLKLIIILQKILDEFQLSKLKEQIDMVEVVDRLYQAEDISMIKSLFVSQMMELMEQMHSEESNYTPVVKQVLSIVKHQYMEDLSLKTLAYKFNMNTSYLGQVFQKEVGCSFSQYLNNARNQKARELILNTSMRIHDIATAVGYPDTSYFYRKFKKSYGVSPATLREMKQY